MFFSAVNPEDLQDNIFKLIGTDWMLVTAKKNDEVNTMTASWGGFGVMWGKNVAYIVLRPQRYTKEFVDSSDTFSLTFFDEKYKKDLSYLGSVSGRNEDKLKNVNLTICEDDTVPYFEEARIAFICKNLFAQSINSEMIKDDKIDKKWYPNRDYHTLYIAEIEKVLVRE